MKEAIFISRLLKALTLKLNELLVIECDNWQTFRLVMKKSMKLSTKLWHVDIHNHWLQQENAEQRVLFKWISTRNMIADELTKALPWQCHEIFMKMISLEDISAWIQIEKQMKALRDKIRNSKADKIDEQMMFLTHRDVKTGWNLKRYWYLAIQHLHS